jgi:hypothetical protein
MRWRSDAGNVIGVIDVIGAGNAGGVIGAGDAGDAVSDMHALYMEAHHVLDHVLHCRADRCDQLDDHATFVSVCNKL